MTVASVGTIRDAIATRLATLGEPLRVYDTMPESVSLPQVAIIRPVPNPTGSWWASAPTGVLVYRFEIDLFIDTQRGLAKAQDAMDGYISPAGTHADSIENNLEDRTTSDNLTTYTTSVKVDQFRGYDFTTLHEQDGVLHVTIPVECLIDGDG